MYTVGWYSAPGCLPDSTEDGFESAEDAWNAVASDLYTYGDEYLWEYAEGMIGFTGEGVASLDPTGLAYGEVWRTEE